MEKFTVVYVDKIKRGVEPHLVIHYAHIECDRDELFERIENDSHIRESSSILFMFRGWCESIE